MAGLLVKAIAVWVVILAMAIVNAGIREKLLAPTIGSGFALPASGLLLSVIVFIIALISTPVFGSTKSKVYIIIGVIWFALTLSFEFLFGHFIVGTPWLDIVHVLDVRTGNLFIVSLFATLVAPWLSAKARGLI